MEDTKMELNKIKEHWENLAKKYAEDLKSTTKTPTIKHLEINAIFNAIKGISDSKTEINVLEVGCGNGHNLFGLSKLFNNYSFTGVDYSQQMISNAVSIPQFTWEFDFRFQIQIHVHMRYYKRRHRM